MDVETIDSLNRLMDNWNLTSDEKKFIAYSNTATTADMNHSTVLAELFLTKQINLSTNAIINSNKLLAEAENENSKRMQKLTWALVIVGFLQVIATIVNLYVAYSK